MSMPNMGEILILLLLAVIVLGPARLPEYTRRLAQGARRVREYSETARGRLSEELGPGFEDVDWKALDPRQYDPRRIVREAFTDAPEASDTTRPGTADPAIAAGASAAPSAATAERPPSRPTRVVRDPDAPTPFDPEAT